MKGAKAFSPCHITGLFQIFDQQKDPLQAGSKGAGVSLIQGVETRVRLVENSENSWAIRVNDSASTSMEVSERILIAFASIWGKTQNFHVNVEHYVDVPIGAGLGTSGAAALSLALALNKASNLRLSNVQAAQYAHVAEIECKTGLGTVIAETFGGLEIRVKPGAPGIGEVRHIAAPDNLVVVCLTFGSLPTKKFLTDEETRRRINEIGGELLKKLVDEPEVTNFLKLSRQFAEKVGLITERVRKVMNATDKAGFLCSMPMFGEAIFTLIDEESVEDFLKVIQPYKSNAKTIISKIDFKGARLLP